MSGALVFDDYLDLVNQKKITGLIDKKLQIQPSSVDLSLSNECYEIKASFLSPKTKVRNKLKKNLLKRIDIRNGQIF